MAIAKNFVQEGVWGINSSGFTSSSSSLLYSLLLSFIYLIFGVNEITPLILNLVFAHLLIYLIYFILKNNNFPSYAIFLCLIFIIFFIPLPHIVFSGMEHTIQIFLTIIFVYYASKLLSEEFNEKKIFSSERIYLLILVPLVALIRFEGMFLVLTVSVLFLLRKKIIYSILIGGFGFLPILIYGLISTINGWYFFPNSLILKTNALSFNSGSIFNMIYDFSVSTTNKLLECPHILLFLIGVSLILYSQCFKKKEVWKDSTIMSIIFISITLFHVIFAQSSILSRYDAYIVALGLFAIIFSTKNYIPQKLNIKKHLLEIKEDFSIEVIFQKVSIILFIMFILLPYIIRSGALILTIKSTNNIYEQQYQMGLFLNKYYNNEVVAANDIGAINYLADVECIDLMGLGTLDIVAAILKGNFTDETIFDLTKDKNCKIAIIYDSWFNRHIPSQWIKIGEWTIIDNVACGSDTVSFYAVDPEESTNLIANLKEFSPQLPEMVIESGNYTE